MTIIPGLPPGVGQLVQSLAGSLLGSLGGLFSSYPDLPEGFHYASAKYLEMIPEYTYGPWEYGSYPGGRRRDIESVTYSPGLKHTSHIVESSQGWPVARIRKSGGSYNLIPLAGISSQGYPAFSSDPESDSVAALLSATFPPASGPSIAKNLEWAQLAGLPGPGEEPSEAPPVGPAIPGSGSPSTALGALAAPLALGIGGYLIAGPIGAFMGFLLSQGLTGGSSSR